MFVAWMYHSVAPILSCNFVVHGINESFSFLVYGMYYTLYPPQKKAMQKASQTSLGKADEGT